jgi:exonuclease III
MNKICKKLIAIILTVSMLSAFACFSYAEDGSEKKSVSLSIISSNVDGLPIPSFVTKDKRSVPTSEKLIGQQLNNSGYDIVCVQEDFQYHSILAKQMTNYKYDTYTSGGIPVGDGVNIFSKYPIYNIERVTWTDFNGILDAANDGLTPKGFVKCTADVNGVLVDIYDIHVDANGSEADCKAKEKQFNQLAAYISANSADRPVLITGDYNATLHCDYLANMYEIMIVGNGFKDAWAEVKNNGNYFRSDGATDLINQWYAQYNGQYWGIWDSVERLLYKSGAGATVTATDFSYEEPKSSEVSYTLSDHNIMKSTVEIDTTNYVRPDITLTAPTDTTTSYKITHGIKMVVRCLSLIIGDLLVRLGKKM